MIDYRRKYRLFFGYGEQSYAPCENCGKPMDDVHHLERRGSGGVHGLAAVIANAIENLMGLCRKCHDRAEGTREPKLEKEYLKAKHLAFIEAFKKYNPFYHA